MWVHQRRPGMVGEFLRESVVPRLQSSGSEVLLSEELPPNDLGRESLAVITDSLHESELFRLRKHHRGAKILIADPKLANQDDIDIARKCDVALVASLELKVTLESLGVESLLVYWVPELDHVKQSPRRRNTVAYHGNKVHLMSMEETTLAALEAVNSRRADRSQLVLECHYNIEKLGLWKSPATRTTIRHTQFSPPDTWESIASATVGIVPNLLPPQENRRDSPKMSGLINRKLLSSHNPLLLREDDVNLRYKINTNAARIYPFAYFKTPVIADLSASVAVFVHHGLSGLLCWNRESWEAAISTASQNPSVVREYSEELYRRAIPEMHPQTSVERLNRWISNNCRPEKFNQ